MTGCILNDAKPTAALRMVEACRTASEAAMLAALKSLSSSLPDADPMTLDGLVSSALCEAYCRHFGPTLAGDGAAIVASATHLMRGLTMMAEEGSPARDELRSRAAS